jgi:hypothetical protein
MDISAAEKWTALAFAVIVSVASVVHAQTTKPLPKRVPIGR